jgi:SOS response regulatory protein OraA/RecX
MPIPRTKSRLLKRSEDASPSALMQKMDTFLTKKGFVHTNSTRMCSILRSPVDRNVDVFLSNIGTPWMARELKPDGQEILARGATYAELVAWVTEYLEGHTKTSSINLLAGFDLTPEELEREEKLLLKKIHLLLKKGFIQKDVFTYFSPIEKDVYVYLMFNPENWYVREKVSEAYRQEPKLAEGKTFAELAIWVNEYLESGGTKQAALSTKTSEVEPSADSQKCIKYLLKKGFSHSDTYPELYFFPGKNSPFGNGDYIDLPGTFYPSTFHRSYVWAAWGSNDTETSERGDNFSSLVIFVENWLTEHQETKTSASKSGAYQYDKCREVILRKGFKPDPAELSRYVRGRAEIHLTPSTQIPGMVYWDYYADDYVKRPTKSGDSYSALVLLLAELAKPKTSAYEKEPIHIQWEKMCDYLLKKGFSQRSGDPVFFLPSDISLAVYVQSGDHWAARRRVADSNFKLETVAAGDSYSSLVVWVNDYLEQTETGKTSADLSDKSAQRDKCENYLLKKGFRNSRNWEQFQAPDGTWSITLPNYVNNNHQYHVWYETSSFPMIEDDDVIIGGETYSSLVVYVEQRLAEGQAKTSAKDPEPELDKMKVFLKKRGFHPVGNSGLYTHGKVVIILKAGDKWVATQAEDDEPLQTLAEDSTYSTLVLWVTEYLEGAVTKTSSDKSEQRDKCENYLLKKGFRSDRNGETFQSPDYQWTIRLPLYLKKDSNWPLWMEEDSFLEDEGELISGETYSSLVVYVEERLGNSAAPESKTSASHEIYQKYKPILTKMEKWLQKQGFESCDPWPWWYSSPDKTLYIWVDMQLQSFDDEDPCLWWATNNAELFEKEFPPVLGMGSTFAELVAFVNERGLMKTSSSEEDYSKVSDKIEKWLLKNGFQAKTPFGHWFAGPNRRNPLFVYARGKETDEPDGSLWIATRDRIDQQHYEGERTLRFVVDYQGETLAELVSIAHDYVKPKTSSADPVLDKIEKWLARNNFTQIGPFKQWFRSPDASVNVWLKLPGDEGPTWYLMDAGLDLEGQREEDVDFEIIDNTFRAKIYTWFDDETSDLSWMGSVDIKASGNTYAEFVVAITQHLPENKTSAAGEISLNRAAEFLERKGFQRSRLNAEKFDFPYDPGSYILVYTEGGRWIVRGELWENGLDMSGSSYSSLALFVNEYLAGKYDDDDDWPETGRHHLEASNNPTSEP